MKKVIPGVHITTILALLWSVALATGIGAQTRFAALEGEVMDERGAAIAGAQITVKNLATGLERTATTGEHGRYLLEHLPPGAYDMTASMSGMRPALVKGQQLLVGTTATINLQLAVGPVTEEVQISAATALVETTRSETGQVIQRTEVDSLPIVDRSFSSLALLTPTVQTDRVAGGLSIGGQRGFNNNHIVDGVTNRNQILGTQLIAFSQDWVEEFRVHTNGYDAQFGQASGGIINAVTRSGGNQFHGRGFGFFRASELDATPAFTGSKPTLSQQRPGGTFSGPLKREKLFFFTGFEYLNSDSEAIVTSPHEVCAAPSKRDAATNNCLAPTGNNTSLFLAKVDWMAGAKHLVNARYNRQDFSDFNSAVGGFSTVEHGRFNDLTIWAIAGAWTSSPSPQITNELRGLLNRQSSFGGVNAGQTFEIQRPSGLLGAPVNYGLIGQDWLQLVDNFSIIRGAHSLKLGAEFSNIRRYDNFWPKLSPGIARRTSTRSPCGHWLLRSMGLTPTSQCRKTSNCSPASRARSRRA